MKVSMKTDYALRALFTLVKHFPEPNCWISIQQLAEENDIPKRFLEHILLEMKSKGWVRSTMGKRGGYRLAKSPQEITIGQVIRHFDGVLSPIGCVSAEQYEPCNQEPVCKFRRLFLEIRNFSAAMAEKTTLAQVWAGKPVSNMEVFDLQFIEGAGI